MLGGSGSDMQKRTKENLALKKRTRERYLHKLKSFQNSKRIVSEKKIQKLSLEEQKRLKQKSQTDIRNNQFRSFGLNMMVLGIICMICIYILIQIST